MSYPVYLDYAATTPVDPIVADEMIPWLTTKYGNPASTSHLYGWEAEEAVEKARGCIAALVNCSPREIIFTSGATESNNLAIKGAALRNKGKGNHIVTVKTEHKAVLDTCKELERQGFEVTYLDTDSKGVVNINTFANAIQPNTIIASVMHVNNETGVIQDITALGKVCSDKGVLFHVDAAQSASKLSIDLKSLPVDFMSFSGHKVYGPKGVGALYVKRQSAGKLQALIHGGGHERGMRSGTLATHQIVGMGAAFEQAARCLQSDYKRINDHYLNLTKGLLGIDGISINGCTNTKVPHITNISFHGVNNEALIMSLPELALSSGSACTSASLEPSHVLRGMGCSDELALCSIRISIGRFTTKEQIDNAVGLIKYQVERLRALSPVWNKEIV